LQALGYFVFGPGLTASGESSGVRGQLRPVLHWLNHISDSVLFFFGSFISFFYERLQIFQQV
jgi:hypothetical protein